MTKIHRHNWFSTALKSEAASDFVQMSMVPLKLGKYSSDHFRWGNSKVLNDKMGSECAGHMKSSLSNAKKMINEKLTKLKKNQKTLLEKYWDLLWDPSKEQTNRVFLTEILTE